MMKQFQQILFYAVMVILMTACGGGDSAPPGSSVPSVPDNIQAVSGSNQVSLSWNDADGAKTYNIYWGTTSRVSVTDATDNGRKLVGVTSPYDHTDLTNGMTYYYIVAAANEFGESPPSSEVLAIPQLLSVPNNVQAMPEISRVTLSWGNVGYATSYNIYWNNDGDVTTSSNKIPDAISPFDHLSLSSGTRYYYIITAVNVDGGESVQSAEVSATPVSSVLYVSESGSDGNEGLSTGTPKKTITAAIAAATAPALIKVSVGTYSVNSNPSISTHVVLKEGVSLYGGYNDGFTTYDPPANPTVIIDSSTIATFSYAPNRALEAGTGISHATVVDGFTVKGGTRSGTGNTYMAAIWTHDGGSPTVQNNILYGGSYGGTSMAHLYGMLNYSSSPIVQNNTLNGGSGGVTTRTYGMLNSSSSPIMENNNFYGGKGNVTYGLYNNQASSPSVLNNSINGGSSIFSSCGIRNDLSSNPIVRNNSINGGSGGNSEGFSSFSSSPIVQNNTINGGIATSNSYGVTNYGGAKPIIQNNTINGGAGNVNRYGIWGNYSTSPTIDNNIIFILKTGMTGQSYCIYESSATGDTASLRNNDLYNCAIIYRDFDAGCTTNEDGDGDATTCTLMEMQALSDFGTGGVINNISVDPLFLDIEHNQHFSISSPVEVTAGGLNGEDDGGWGFTTDKDDVVRPGTGSPWSMGAYEPEQ